VTVVIVELFESPSRVGHGPRNRYLTALERLTFAAMSQLFRDDDLGQKVAAAAASRPSCLGLGPDVPTRYLVTHVTSGSHAVGDCREWLATVVQLADQIGCPSLDAVLIQVDAALKGIRPGLLRATRLRNGAEQPPDGFARPRRPRGTQNRPARDLLARRAHEMKGLGRLRAEIARVRTEHGVEPVGASSSAQPPTRGGWAGLAQEFDREIDGWQRGEAPDRFDIAYPAWREWWRNKPRRQGRGRDPAKIEDSVRQTGKDLGQQYRKRAAVIRRLLLANLPDLSSTRVPGSPAP
jgi:hypothetical protein